MLSLKDEITKNNYLDPSNTYIFFLLQTKGVLKCFMKTAFVSVLRLVWSEKNKLQIKIPSW